MIHEFAALKLSFHIPIMVLLPGCVPVNCMVKLRDDSTVLEFNRATATNKKVKQVLLLILEKLHTVKNAMVRRCRQSKACFGTTGCSQRWWKWRQQTWQPNPLNHSHINNDQHKSAPRLTPTGKLSQPEWATEGKLHANSNPQISSLLLSWKLIVRESHPVDPHEITLLPSVWKSPLATAKLKWDKHKQLRGGLHHRPWTRPTEDALILGTSSWSTFHGPS